MICNNGFESIKKSAKTIPLSKKKVALSKRLSGAGINCFKITIKRFQSIFVQMSIER